MQEELSWLTATLKRSSISDSLGSGPEKGDILPAPQDNDNATTLIAAGHVVRHGGTQIERYFGPWTLVAQCHEFEGDLLSHVDGNYDQVVYDLVKKMLLDTTIFEGDNSDIGTQAGPPETNLCLPPRQLLAVMLDTFLKQADYSTDIFCHQTVYEAYDSVYREPSSPTSEAWALCFNLIILLTLGAEHPVHSEDPFVRPILQAAHATARKATFFMSPRLVNVQALALFSLLAQQYHTDNETLGDFIFGQACILARESGLHQTSYGRTPSSTLSAIEAEERQKVFRSLYIRDRYSATACGAPTWLPNHGPRAPITPLANTQGGNLQSQPNVLHTPHWELSQIQDGLYRLLSSTDTPDMSTSERRYALTQLQQRLDVWSQAHKVPSLERPTTVDEISLHLAFLGTRLRALDSETRTDDVAHSASEEALNDARLSCLLLATSCDQQVTQALADRLDQLLSKRVITPPKSDGTRSSSNSISSTSASSPCSAASNASHRASSAKLLLSNANFGPMLGPLPLHRLANVFPTAAIFIIARHVLGMKSRTRLQFAPSTARYDGQRQHEINDDVLLLEALLFRFRSSLPVTTAAAGGKMNSSLRGSKLGRVIEHLVAIVHAIRGSKNRGGAADADGDADDNDVYAPEPLLGSTSSLLLDTSNTASMSNLNFYGGSGDLSPSQLDLPPTPPSSKSTWAVPQDLMAFSATPVLTTASSSYAPSVIPTPPIMADTPFDISQFLHQMGTNSPVMWDNGQGQGEMQVQQHLQEPQVSPETTTKRRSRKRLRTDGNVAN